METDTTDTKYLKCAKEAIDLLNCTTASNYDQDKCLPLIQSLRLCVLGKKVKMFSLWDQTKGKVDPLDPKEKGT